MPKKKRTKGQTAIYKILWLWFRIIKKMVSFGKKKKNKSKATEYTRTTVIEYDQKSIQTDSSFLILFLNLLMFWAVFL